MLPDDLKPPSAPRKKARSRNLILHWAGYLATAGVAAAELLEIHGGPRFAWTAGLLAAFAAMLAVVFNAKRARGKGGFLAAMLAASGIAIAVMAVGATPFYGAILFFVLCTIAGMMLPVGAAIAWVIGAASALFVCLLVRGDGGWLPTMVSLSVGLFAFTAISVAFRRSNSARAESQQLLAELMSAQGRLRDMAIMEERQRLAREMHDAVGHRLTAAAVLLEGAARLIPSEPARATRMVESSRAQVRQGLDELRAAVSALRADAPGTQPLPEILGALADVFAQGAEAKVSLDLQPGMTEPEPDRKLVIVRSAQEALTNVQKHAAATRVELALKTEGSSYVLTCRDNGRGLTPVNDANAAPGAAGFGLENLRARAAAFGGRVDLEPAPDGGALLRLTLPAAGGALNA